MVATHANSFSSLHLNISSLPYHFEKFNELLNSLCIHFSVIGITKSCLNLNVEPLVNINLKNYNTEETPTESENGGALLYISWMHIQTSQNVNTRVQQYLDANFRKNFDGKHGCISNESFNINLINYDSHNPTFQFLDNTCSNSFSPHINILTCHAPRSKTLVDNFFFTIT